MQSGYARQYLFKDLFKVFFGGVLLAHLKLSVTDSRKVLDDLSPWLGNNGFFDQDFSGKENKETTHFSNEVWICFCPLPSPASDGQTGFRYLIRNVVDVQPVDSAHPRRIAVTCEDDFIPEEDFNTLDVLHHPGMHVINLSAMYDRVVAKLTQ